MGLIRNAVFDLGNVLLDYNPGKYLEEHWNQRGHARDLLELIFLGEEWGRMDEGTLTLEGLVDLCCGKRPDLSEEIQGVLSHWTEILHPLEDTVKVLEELHSRGVPLYYLSNMQPEGIRYTRGCAFYGLFRGGVFSCDELLVKPDPAIYHRLLDKLGLRAEECLFVDDLPANVEAANGVGFRGHLFQGVSGLREELAAVGL